MGIKEYVITAAEFQKNDNELKKLTTSVESLSKILNYLVETRLLNIGDGYDFSKMIQVGFNKIEAVKTMEGLKIKLI